MENSKEYYYTYYSYEEWGRGYFGSRGCKCLPEEDIKYFGSFSDKTFKPTQKIILKSDYSTREEAYVDEIILQKYYKVVENYHFANRAYQTSTSFNVYGYSPWNKGKSMSEEQKTKLSESCIGRKITDEVKEKIRIANSGKKFSEEHRQKISEATKGKSKTKTKKFLDAIEKNISLLRNIPRKPHTEDTKEKIRNSKLGKEPWNKGLKGTTSKPILYNGTYYSSISEAVRKTDDSRSFIINNSVFM